MTKELDIHERHLWKGMELQVAQLTDDLRVLTAINFNGEAGYKQAVQAITDLNITGTSLLRDLALPQYEKRKPTYTAVVIPSSQFLQVTGIPENFSWATICSRLVWQDMKEDAVVVSSAHAKSLDFPIGSPVSQLKEPQVDLVREIVHEHLPTLRDTYFPYLSRTALPISEAMDETVPRYVLGLQKSMAQSSHFLTELPEGQLLTVSDLWGGFSQHSSNSVSSNRAYGSAFLLGRGLMARLEGKYGLNKKEALGEWLETMIKAVDGKDVVTKLADKIGVSEDILWNGKQLQREGQEIVGAL